MKTQQAISGTRVHPQADGTLLTRCFFYYRKVISVDRGEHAARRRALAKMLAPATDPKSQKTSLLTFTLVSEPPGKDLTFGGTG